MKTDIVSPVKPFDFVGQFDGVPVTPADPEGVLAAVGAAMRTAARELDNRGPAQPKTAVARPVLDQLPPNPVGAQVRNRRPFGSYYHSWPQPIRDAGDAV